jgi:hypothetical protein
LQAIFENADPEERAFLNEIETATRQFQLWHIQQTLPRRKACRQQWAKNTEADPSVKAWFLGLAAAERIDYFDDSDSYPVKFPRP